MSSIFASGFSVSSISTCSDIRVSSHTAYHEFKQVSMLAGASSLLWKALLRVAAIFCWFFIVDFPQLEGFLKEDEKVRVIERLNKDRGDGEHDDITFAKVIHHLSDWKLWGFALIVFSFTCY